MNDHLRDSVLTRLEADYGFKVKTGGWLREGICPACNKKELYVNADKPWMLRCGRLNKCGAEFAVKDLYRDLFDDWSSRFKATDIEPAATASAYLQFCRGFDPQITAGEFSQDNFYSNELKAGSATVRFPLDKGGFWERIIDRPHRFGKMKARFAPGQRYNGHWWKPARVSMATVKELWITEGIFDAIALLHHDIDAVSALSSNHFPEESLKALMTLRGADLPRLVWALDGDSAGSRFTRKFIKLARDMGFECSAAIIVKKDRVGKRLDWNDLHLRDDLCSDTLDECRYQGALLIAESPTEKAQLMYVRTERREFWFGFNNRLYWFKFDDRRHAEALKTLEDNKKAAEMNDDQRRAYVLQQAGIVTEIANCYPEALYHQSADITDESWYYLRISFPHSGQIQKMAFTPAQISSAGDFKKKLLNAAGAWWLGNQHQLDVIMKSQTYNIKSVQTIDYVGYSRDHKAWLLGDLAVRNGVVTEVNDEDFFEFEQLRLKSLMKSIQLSLQRDSEHYRDDWFDMLWTCFGEQGVIALAFWVGSAFCEQIRAQHQSFPFLEATGEAGAGKTTLIMFLWKLFGRNYQGFDPSKSSVAGRSRAMGQVASMPVVFIEGDRNTPDKAHSKSFEWDELKDFFDGGTLRTRGVKNAGNDTYEPPFRATICISQNADVNASEAILTRLIKLRLKRPVATTESRAAADNLNLMPVQQLSYFFIKTVKAEKAILERFNERAKLHETVMRSLREIRIERISKNHAQIMALVDCLALVTPITPEQITLTQQRLVAMAIERQHAVEADHPYVTQFWEVYEYLEQRAPEHTCAVNHSSDPSLVAINLNEFAEQAVLHKQQITDLTMLRELLKSSKRYAFVDSNRPTHSTIRASGGISRSATVKCWIFKKPKQS